MWWSRQPWGWGLGLLPGAVSHPWGLLFCSRGLGWLALPGVEGGVWYSVLHKVVTFMVVCILPLWRE